MKQLILITITAIVGTFSVNAQKLNREESTYEGITSKVIE